MDENLCRSTLEIARTNHDARPPRPDKDSKISVSPAQVVTALATGLARMAPGSAARIDTDLHSVPTVLDPDTVSRLSGGARALTIEDGGQGRPVVLCPFAGRLRDAMALAHELGHALQYLNAKDPVPPIMREVAAFLAEHAMIDGLRDVAPDVATHLQQYWDFQTWHIFHGGAAALHRALATPGARYHYDWNYPMARMAVLTLLAPDLSPQRSEHLVTAVLNGRLQVSDCLAS